MLGLLQLLRRPSAQTCAVSFPPGVRSAPVERTSVGAPERRLFSPYRSGTEALDGHGARHLFSFPLSSGLKPTFAIAESLGRTRAVLGQLLGFVTSGQG